MAKNGKTNQPAPEHMPRIHPHAAGIDVGAAEHWGGPAARDAQPVHTFRACTCDWSRLATWLTACRLPTVAMASPGVYGLPLFQMLETRGFPVALGNACHGKNVPGRPTTDHLDGRWRQKLQRYGVVAPAGRPPEESCQLPSLLRHRDHRIPRSAQHMHPMQKALEQLHRHQHHGINELTGGTGRRLLRAMVAGARHPEPRAPSRDDRLKAAQAPSATALAGADRSAPGCTLPLSLAVDDFTPQHIAACEQELERVLGTFAALGALPVPPCPPPTTAQRHPQRHAPAFALRSPLDRITGGDRPPGPGVQALPIPMVRSAVGRHMPQWPTEQHCASWLGPARRTG